MLPALLFLLASLFYLVAGVGLIRLPDPLARLHAGTKASSLATALALAAAVAHHDTWWSAAVCGASLFFVFLTAPLASHAIARCVLRHRLDDPATATESEAGPAGAHDPETGSSPQHRESLPA